MISIRELETPDDLQQLEALQKKIWQFADIDTIPLILTIAHKEAGSMWIGAFDGTAMIGFAFGFLGSHQGELTVHSHLLGVLPECQNTNLGYRLKLAQRDWALALRVGSERIRKMTWTFDPLQSKNAYFNFGKLGVTSDSYKVDFYGTQTSSVLHRNGTDRLLVAWLLSDPRVENRLRQASREAATANPELVLLVRHSTDGRPLRTAVGAPFDGAQLGIQIPLDIASIEQAHPDHAREWRDATRWAFMEAIRAGYFVLDFYRDLRGPNPSGTYLMQKGRYVSGS
jgi:predicted GNAT superfamily acetyltransferase